MRTIGARTACSAGLVTDFILRIRFTLIVCFPAGRVGRSPFAFFKAEHATIAEVVKLADTQRSGRCARKGVGVQISPSAHREGKAREQSQRG